MDLKKEREWFWIFVVVSMSLAALFFLALLILGR
jgi:hypothetical protein